MRSVKCVVLVALGTVALYSSFSAMTQCCGSVSGDVVEKQRKKVEHPFNELHRLQRKLTDLGRSYLRMARRLSREETEAYVMPDIEGDEF